MDFILSTCKGAVINIINIVINLSTLLSSAVYCFVDNYQKERFKISAGSRYSSPSLWDIPCFLSSESTLPVKMFPLSANSFSSSSRRLDSSPTGSFATRTLSRTCALLTRPSFSAESRASLITSITWSRNSPGNRSSKSSWRSRMSFPRCSLPIHHHILQESCEALLPASAFPPVYHSLH